MAAIHPQDRFATRAVHAGCEPEPTTGAVVPPVFFTSTYVQPAPAEHLGYEYSRTGNPTRTALEQALAALEGASPEGGALAFASGMSAIDACLRLLAAGDHVVAGNDLYGGTYRLFTQVLERFGLSFTFVDSQDPRAIKAALTATTRMVWLESPSNPLLRITDLAQATALARAHGALSVVDNTFASPALQQPLTLGADLVVHSTTKYLGGHADVVGGAIVTHRTDLLERLAFLQNAVGAVPGPMDCFLVHRGLRTLSVRMERHCQNAREVAAYLKSHPRVSQVHYPGLEEHPGHEVAKRQMGDFGGMVSFELEATVKQAKQAVTRTRLFQLAESLGGVESLVEHPASMTHAAIPAETRRAAGLADGLIRLSVGIEAVEDLLADLQQALF